MNEFNKHSRGDLIVGNWNVRTLVESSGDIYACVCRKRPVGEKSEVADRKLDLVVGELKRYRVAYRRASGLGRTSGLRLMGTPFFTMVDPSQLRIGDASVRNEGVGIVLDEKATGAWRQAGEV